MDKKKKVAAWDDLKRLFLIYREGDDAVTSKLFSELEKVLLGFYRVRMGSSSELDDMVQTTLMKIHFARDRFDEKLSLKTWVFTIAQRTLIDHWRAGAHDKESLSPLSETNDEVDPALALAEVVEIQSDVKKALEKLKPIDRSAVYLYSVEGMSMSEIAEIHGTTEGAMKTRVHRACKELKALLVSLIVFLFVRENL